MDPKTAPNGGEDGDDEIVDDDFQSFEDLAASTEAKLYGDEDDDVDVATNLPALDDEDELEVFVDDDEDEPVKKKGQADDDEFIIDDDDDDKDLTPAAREKIAEAKKQIAAAKAESARLATEMEALRKTSAKPEDVLDLQKALIDSSKRLLEMERKEARELLKDARDDGDSDKELEAEEKIRALEKRAGVIEDAENGLQRAAQELKDKPASKADGDGPKNSEAAERWLQANSEWWNNNKDFAIERNAVLTIDEQLTDEGYDPNSDEFTTEMAKRLARKFPDLPVRTASGKRVIPKGKRRRGRRAGATEAGRGDDVSRKPKPTAKNTRLTQEDYRVMAKFGMDTKDENVLAEYRRNKAQSERAEQAAQAAARRR